MGVYGKLWIKSVVNFSIVPLIELLGDISWDIRVAISEAEMAKLKVYRDERAGTGWDYSLCHFN